MVVLFLYFPKPTIPPISPMGLHEPSSDRLAKLGASSGSTDIVLKYYQNVAEVQFVYSMTRDASCRGQREAEATPATTNVRHVSGSKQLITGQQAVRSHPPSKAEDGWLLLRPVVSHSSVQSTMRASRYSSDHNSDSP